jgi:hypothetical protein
VALLIGISDYLALSDTANASGPNGTLTDLLGPDNDVRRMRASLLQWGFTDTTNVTVLHGSRAARAGIASAFRWVQERASDTSDVVVVYFSGHGTSVRDDDRDESDGRDEAIVPYDARDFKRAADVVTDDSIGVWLSALKTRNVTIIIDACYSGTITRGEPEGRAKGFTIPQTGAVRDAILDRGGARLGHTLITAARSFELAQELAFPRGSEQWNGVLTYHLTRMLDGASATRGLRYDDLMGALRQAVAGERVSQVPQVEGDSTSPLFRSNIGVASRPFALMTSQRGSAVSIGVGAVHGVRASAMYDVFGPAETRFAGGQLARVRVNAVEDTISHGIVVNESGDEVRDAPPLPQAARAVLALVPLGGSAIPRLRIFVDSSAASHVAALRTRVDTTRIEFVRDPTQSHAVITKRRGVLEVLADGAALPPQPADEQLPRRSVAPEESPAGYSDAALCKALTRAFSIAKLHALNNPSAPAALRAYVRVVPSGSEPPFDTLSAVDSVRAGTAAVPTMVDVYAKLSVPYEVARRTRLYVSAAVAGFVSEPYVFWPENQEAEHFPVNSWRPIWRGVPVRPPLGRETVKLVVNSDQYDLRSLVNSAQLCSNRVAGGSTRSPGGADSITGWTTVSRTLHILPTARR